MRGFRAWVLGSCLACALMRVQEGIRSKRVPRRALRFYKRDLGRLVLSL